MCANQKTDYGAVDVPDDKPADEYEWPERRADLLDRVLAAGSPSAINQTALAGRYGVTQSQISQDMDALADHVEGVLGERAAFQLQAAYDRTVRDLFDAGESDWRATQAAWSVVKEWGEWAGYGPDDGETGGGGGGGLSAGATGHTAEQTPADAYEIVYESEGDDDPKTMEELTAELPMDDDGNIDYKAAGFNHGPGGGVEHPDAESDAPDAE